GPGTSTSGCIRDAIKVGNGYIDPRPIRCRSPFDAPQRRPRAHLRLPQDFSGIRIESVVNPALLARADYGFGTRRSLVRDFIRCGTEIKVWAGGLGRI